MGARTLYPLPPCPCCGKRDNRVKNTNYTDDGQILRNRGCNFCGESWWTLQPSEQNVNTETHRIVLPSSYRNSYKRHSVRLEQIPAA